MALSYNSSSKSSEGAYWRVFANLSPDTSYATGGYTIIPERIGLTRIEKVSVPNNPAGIQFNWDSTTGKLLMGGYTGGGGALAFTGTPMGGHIHTFTGAALGDHSHLINSTTETITQSADVYFIAASATGFFVIGETITGGTSGATATVTVGNVNPTGDLGINPLVGGFIIGETITGGTSGVTATVASGNFRIYAPALSPAALIGATRASTAGLALIPTANDVNPDMHVQYNTLVGAFTDFEQITGGTSGVTAIVNSRHAGGLMATQVNWVVPGFTLGETITGGTSGATAVVTECYFDNTIVYRRTSSTNPSGDFIVFYPVSVNMSPVSVSYLSISTAIQSASVGTPGGTISLDSAGTPAGTITGGGAISFAEFPAATNVYALLNAFDVIIEGV